MDFNVIDEWINVNDTDAFKTARRIVKEEGILAGGSSGAVLWAALQVAKDIPEDKRLLVIFPDSTRNYLTKFGDDDYMLEHEMMTQDEYDGIHFCDKDSKIFGENNKINEIELPNVSPVSESMNLNELLKIFKEQNTTCV